jgi:hypothetical protein
MAIVKKVLADGTASIEENDERDLSALLLAAIGCHFPLFMWLLIEGRLASETLFGITSHRQVSILLCRPLMTSCYRRCLE